MKWKSSKTAKQNSNQYTSIIALDPSTTCTGLCVDNELTAFVKRSLAETKTGKLKRWFEITSEHSDIILINDRTASKNYPTEELLKLVFYRNFTDVIIDKIKKSINCDPSECLVVVEGYSYSSTAGHLIDLVGFSTLLRSKLLDAGFVNLEIISPSSLKLATAKMSYEPEEVFLNKKKTKSKLVWKNNNSVTGGKFKKDDMMQAILDSDYTNSKWKSFLKENSDDLTSINVPKPIEDLNDAFLLYNVYKNGFNE